MNISLRFTRSRSQTFLTSTNDSLVNNSCDFAVNHFRQKIYAIYENIRNKHIPTIARRDLQN